MKTCPTCQTQLDRGASTCPKCGKKFTPWYAWAIIAIILLAVLGNLMKK